MYPSDENNPGIANASASTTPTDDCSVLCQTKPKRQLDDGKLERLIVLMDIDATMLESKWFSTQEEADKHVANLPKDAEGKTVRCLQTPWEFDDDIWVIKFRPGLRQFLDELSPIVDLHIYTAGTKRYAHCVRREIESMCGKRYFSPDKVWSREEHVHFIEGGSYYKHLDELPLGRNDLSRVILIDDNSNHLVVNPGNVYPIGKFSNDNTDTELMHAVDFLKNQLIGCSDVRPVMRARKEEAAAFRYMMGWKTISVQQMNAYFASQSLQRAPMASSSLAASKETSPSQ